MESDQMREARRNEVGHCGEYCRTCHWYNDALRKPAAQLLIWSKAILRLQAELTIKAVIQKKQSRDLKYSQRVHALSTVRVAAAGAVAQFVNAALQKALISVSNVLSFHAKEIGVKKVNTLTFLQLIR